LNNSRKKPMLRPKHEFLYLLKGQPDGIAEFFLAHRQHRPAQPHATADMHIDWIGPSGSVTGLDFRGFGHLSASLRVIVESARKWRPLNKAQ